LEGPAGMVKSSRLTASGREFRIGEWQVVPSRRILLQHGREVIPRAKVFDLLLYLLERRDRVVTREELLSALWSGRAIAENSLAQCVIELRKILGDDARNPRFIQTVPKAGYRIVATVEEAPAIEVPPDATPSYPPAIEPPPKPGRSQRSLWLAILIPVMVAILIWLLWPGSKTATRSAFRETAWWKLDGPDRTVPDASGYRHNGIAGQDVEWRPAILSHGARFSGLGSGITGPGNGSLPAGSSPRTVSLWVQTTPPFIDNATLFEYGSTYRGQTLERFGFYLNYDAHVVFGPAANYGSLIGTIRLDDGEWHLITASYEGPPANQGSIFIDGRLRDRGPVKAPATDADTQWRIGANLWGHTTFRGAIDDVRIYNFALSPQQAGALYRCTAKKNDYDGYYFLPVGYPFAAIEQEPDGSVRFRNDGKDFTGIQLARPDSECALGTLHGADIGQNLRIAVDLLVPKDGAGHITEAGPYFRSRRAVPGNGIIGGTSGGYWVQLYSTGMVKVKCLNPWGMIAFSPALEGFDASAFHHLEIEAKGERLRVWLDSRLLEFEQGRKYAAVVPIPPAWNGPPRLGKNDGTAGIFAGCEDNRNLMGGQQARNLRVTSLD
jgi:DNA-binding winged helix-turn-helix (wHTH) protein